MAFAQKVQRLLGGGLDHGRVLGTVPVELDGGADLIAAAAFAQR